MIELKDRMASDIQEESRPTSSTLHIVGVGASAGGLDALTKFLTTFNEYDIDMCIVVVMHLSPDYKSQLASILDKRCKWPVIPAEHGINLEAGNIYVTPQNKQIQLVDTNFLLEDLSPEHSFTPSIDNFFMSLAEDKGEKAIGIVLSGFGKDGSKGIRAIHQHGGLTMAQLPETAEHRDMPTAAIGTGKINMVIPAERMYDEIIQYITHSDSIETSAGINGSLDAIFGLLKKRSGTDFSMYKPSTIMRRVNHRIANLQLGSMIEYYELIKSKPSELDNLFDTVLIGVTEFFRDANAFDHLRDQLKELIKEKEPGDSIRIWSVGCATGEEPYSIAILLHELLDHKSDQFHIQIFASDVDDRAIAFGRKGVYNKDSLANLPVEIIKNYFVKHDDLHYKISKEIKQRVLFTKHDITTDPPFVKLDLIVCRNLLIYFNNILQKQTFQIFHYSLRTKGLLFLGKSESVGAADDLFSKYGEGKLYIKAESTLNYQLKFSRLQIKNQKSIKNQTTDTTRNMSIADVAKETLYYKFDNPFVVINDTAEIKEVHGSLRLYLEISQGTMNVNLLKMVNPELVTTVKAALAQVKKTNVIQTSRLVKFKLYEQQNYVRIKIVPLIYRVNEMQFYLVIFEKVEPTEGYIELQKTLETSDVIDLRIKELEDELASAREHLQIFTEELESSNEELQSINEELQSSNEELKSSNEALETSNEELQSSNEELNIANHDLRLTNNLLIEKEQEVKSEKEIGQRNELIYKTISENIPDGAVGILNKNLELEYLAGQGVEEANKNEFIGKYMPTLNPSEKEAKRIEALCKETLKGTSGSIEIKFNNRFYLIKTVLFKLPDSQEDRILYLAQEITSLRQNQIILETAVKASNLILFEYNFDKKELQYDETLYKFLELNTKVPLSEKDFIKKIHPDDVQFRIDDMKNAKKTGQINHELRLKLKAEIVYVRIKGRVLFNENKTAKKAYATILDVTQDKTLLQKVKQSEERFKKIADSAPMTIWITNESKDLTYINKTWLDFTGSNLEDNLAYGWLQFIHNEDKDRIINSFHNAFDNRAPYTFEYRIKKYDNSYEWFLNRGIPKFNINNVFEGYLGSNTNIHNQIEFSEALEVNVSARTREITKANNELIKLNMNLEEFAYMASHDLKEPLRKIRTFNSLVGDTTIPLALKESYVVRIEHSAKRMTDLIDNILEYSKIEQNSIKTTKVLLDQVYAEVISDLSIIINEQQVEITAENLGNIKGNPIRLYQLFSNIIRNAIKFNKKKPIIEITAVDIISQDIPKYFNVKDDQKFKRITVKDNGIGLDVKKKDYIFKPFKKLNAQAEYTGTGIGLAICKRIIDLHKGYIDVESEVGQGSSFIIYLPVWEGNK